MTLSELKFKNSVGFSHFTKSQESMCNRGKFVSPNFARTFIYLHLWPTYANPVIISSQTAENRIRITPIISFKWNELCTNAKINSCIAHFVEDCWWYVLWNLKSKRKYKLAWSYHRFTFDEEFLVHLPKGPLHV